MPEIGAVRLRSKTTVRPTFEAPPPSMDHGSLYPALHRLEDRGWIASFWGTSENNRRARYYRLTPAGRRQLVQQTSRWDAIVRAVNSILRPATE